MGSALFHPGVYIISGLIIVSAGVPILNPLSILLV